MIRTVKRCTSLAATLFIGAILAQGSQAQAPPAGVFSEIQTAVVPRTSPVLEPATVRSRMVRLDTQRINAARRGREILKLNLFDDAEVEVQIRQVRPTRSGYFISGRPRGMDWGEVRLVVSGSVMVGTVISPEGEFTIRSAGSGRHVIRQIDPLQDTFECGADEIPALSPQDLPAVSSIGPAPAGAPSSPAVQAEATPTEDGSEIRILVVYTPALQARQGGVAGMRALVDLMIESANQAYEDSGINPRLVLAHTAMVDYVAKGTNSDLTRLITRDDGYLDEVHTLRNEYAADLVHLLTNVSNGPVGSASRPTFESLSNENRSAFGVTANASEHTFTHEVGHNFGLKHDRYVERPSFAIYPYAFGYTNQAAFGSGAPNAARWRTVMTYNNQCAAAGFGCSRLLRFSNPDQTYLGDPMGVAADSTATGPDGPADARLTINTSARWVGSYRSNACTDFTVSPATQLAPRDGGEFNFEVHANPGCLWQASSQEDFISITSDSSSAGRGLVSVSVKANESATDRTGSVVVAGRTVVVRQLSTTDGICGRSPAAMEAIARAAGYSGAAQCSQVTDEDLARIGTLLFGGSGLTSLKSGDFEGLSALTTLSLDTNQLTELPAGLFAGLANLTKLYLGHNDLTEVPAGIFAGLSKLNRLDLASNQLTGLPAGLFAGLANLEILELDFNQLQDLPAGIFGGLTSLYWPVRIEQGGEVLAPGNP
ncbi:MAG: M12 family metallo-peptidase, partial [Gammaproteobacteria bacterium]|nr:M12 family metallo-peptidase [Gammaproteobacteria bacterium]